MVSSLIPNVDLVPSVTSRVVTINAVDLTEGAPIDGEITFSLCADLYVAADDKIIAAGSKTLTLADGKASIRLPCYDADAVMANGSNDWVIRVHKSWDPNHPYGIRVPAGTTNISLADIPATRPLTGREKQYAVTGASVTVRSSATAGTASGTVALRGGVLDFDFTFPTAAAHTHAIDDVTGLPAEVKRTDKRLDVLEALASEGGTVYENLIVDPVPVNATSTWGAARGTLQNPTGWGRLISGADVGVTYAYPTLERDGVRAYRVKVSPGEKVAAYAQVRAHLEKSTDVTVTVTAYSAGAYKGAVDFKMVTLPAGNYATVVLGGDISAGIDEIGFQIHFTITGSTYPSTGDYAYWRNTALYVGENVPSPAFFASGDSPLSYWKDDANNSPTVTIVPKKASTPPPEVRRDVTVETGLQRRGGVIGTGGKAAVALRFDHHTGPFEAKILPVLKKLRLPWGQMLNAGNIGKGDDTMSTATFFNEACYGGGEVWNHSLTHSNITTEAEADREVTQGLTDLRAAFPHLWIDGWAGPGQPQLMGMEGSDTPEKFWGTYPGQLVVQQHAFVRGYYPGIYTPLTGRYLVGGLHTTMDTSTPEYMDGIIRGAVASRSGVTLMLHPNYLDTTGYLTTAQLEEILTNVANRRDAGELEVLSPTGILMADANRPRQSMSIKAAPASMSGTLTELIANRAFLQTLGVPHECQTWFTASASGTVTLSVKVAINETEFFTRSHSVPVAAGQKVRLGVVFVPHRRTTSVTVSLTGTGSHSGLNYWPI